MKQNSPDPTDIIPERFCPGSRQEWRDWLQAHHAVRQSIWLVYHKKQSARPTVSYKEAVEEALCFGWIDSKKVSLEDDSFMQFFSRRKSSSVWSNVNKTSVARLTDAGLMQDAGHSAVATAKQNGSWTILDEVEALIVPVDLGAAFAKNPGAAVYFDGLSRSDKRAILQWLVLAKRAETRQQRILVIATGAAQRQKPTQVFGRR